jgi:hypothetical protein
MACCCYFDGCRDKPPVKGLDNLNQPHPLVMCPRCQVTEFLSLLFGAKSHEDARPTTESS